MRIANDGAAEKSTTRSKRAGTLAAGAGPAIGPAIVAVNSPRWPERDSRRPIQTETGGGTAAASRASTVTWRLSASAAAACSARAGFSPAMTSTLPRDVYATLATAGGAARLASEASAATLGAQDSESGDQPRLSRTNTPSRGADPGVSPASADVATSIT